MDRCAFMVALLGAALALTACSDPAGGSALPGPGGGVDSGSGAGPNGADAGDGSGGLDDGGPGGGGGDGDGGPGLVDGGFDLDGGGITGLDAGPGGSPDAAPSGPIDGGSCWSGSSGQTAYRVRWAGSGGTAYPVYEINGLPDTSRDKTGAYGYQIGFSPSFVDPYLGQGGLLLNGSSFVDIEISTSGVQTIHQATLSIYGRSYNTTASGSFNWQTFSGIGSSPTNLVSNSAPYEWYSADMTAALAPQDDGVLLRIKSGPSSNSLVVHRIELCVDAE